MRDENEIVRDYLNGHDSREELASVFDLTQCTVCGDYVTYEESVRSSADSEYFDEEVCNDCRKGGWE